MERGYTRTTQRSVQSNINIEREWNSEDGKAIELPSNRVYYAQSDQRVNPFQPIYRYGYCAFFTEIISRQPVSVRKWNGSRWGERVADREFIDTHSIRYLQALLNTRVTTNSIEVVHHVLVNHLNLSQEFLHYFISNSIRSCDQLDEGPVKDRQVKQVARFIQSLLERHIIPMRDYFIEIQSFCISYMKLKGVANLFRLASQEAQQHQINFWLAEEREKKTTTTVILFFFFL